MIQVADFDAYTAAPQEEHVRARRKSIRRETSPVPLAAHRCKPDRQLPGLRGAYGDGSRVLVWRAQQDRLRR